MRIYGWVFGLVIVAGYVVGCSSEQGGTPYGEAEQAPPAEEHAHHHEGPNGGHVVELSDDHSVHGEFVVDAEAKVAKFFILGEDLKTPLEATAVTMHAEGAEGEEAEVVFEPAGEAEAASEFTAALDQLPGSDVEQLFGHFHVTVDGKELAGDLAHDHDHDHDHDHGHDHEHAEGEHEHEHAEGEAAE
jgi:hypothetical protein